MYPFKFIQKFARSCLTTLLLLCTSGYSDYIYADQVQRWQDQQGQWHYGDSTTSHGHQTKPVYISNPISIVQNNSHLQPSDVPTQPKAAARVRKTAHHMKTHRVQKESCEQLREQLAQQPPSGKRKQPAVSRQRQSSEYEHQCIANHYYSNS